MYDPRVVDKFFALHANNEAESPARNGAPTVDPHAMPLQAPAEAASEEAEARTLEMFYELGVAMADQTMPEEVGETLWVHLQARLGADAFVLLTYDEATDSLIPAYRAGEPTLAADSHVPVGDRLSGWVAATRQAIVNSDARLDLDADIRDESLLRSALAVPICIDDRVAGVVAFYSDRSGAFTDAHQRIAEAAAHVVATRPVHVVRPAVAIARAS
jgi:GAF domain-containing protein